MRNPTKKGQYHEALAELELFNAQPAHMVPAPREGGGCINAKHLQWKRFGRVQLSISRPRIIVIFLETLAPASSKQSDNR